MKKKILMLCMGCFFISLTAKAQWVVSDPGQSCPGYHQCRQEYRSHIFHREQYAQQFSGDREDL